MPWPPPSGLVRVSPWPPPQNLPSGTREGNIPQASPVNQCSCQKKGLDYQRPLFTLCKGCLKRLPEHRIACIKDCCYLLNLHRIATHSGHSGWISFPTLPSTPPSNSPAEKCRTTLTSVSVLVGLADWLTNIRPPVTYGQGPGIRRQQKPGVHGLVVGSLNSIGDSQLTNCDEPTNQSPTQQPSSTVTLIHWGFGSSSIFSVLLELCCPHEHGPNTLCINSTKRWVIGRRHLSICRNHGDMSIKTHEPIQILG